MENILDRVSALEVRLNSLKLNNSKTIRQRSALDVAVLTSTPLGLLDAQRSDKTRRYINSDLRRQIRNQQQNGTSLLFFYFVYDNV